MMDNKKTNRLLVWWHGVWEEITRHFLTCDGNKCSLGLNYITRDEGDEELSMQVVDIHGNEPIKLYAYFCPTCGRKLTSNTESA